MTTTLTVPKLGDTADSVVIVEWMVARDDRVEVGQPLLRVETAKVEVEIPAPASGTLVEVLAGVDDELEVGAPLAVIDDE